MNLKNLVNNPKPVIFELGANDGKDTAILHTMFPDGIIYAFEPDRRAIEQFKARNLTNVILIEEAISSYYGFESFYPSDSDSHWNQSGSILRPKEHTRVFPWIQFKEPEFIKCNYLDGFCTSRSIDTIDFMWADVQGAEAKMIYGGKETFRHRVKYLYTEYSKIELYEGCPLRDRILELLPNYTIVEETVNPNTKDYCGDMLLRNLALVK